MYGAIDLLASEYGWSLSYILREVYPEDFFLLLRQIRIRKIDIILQDIAVATNPHKEAEEAKKFVEDLIDQQRYMRGEDETPAETDFAAIDRLRNQIKKESLLVKARWVIWLCYGI